MDEKEQLPKEEKPKSPWQLQKENWYDNLNVTVHQLDVVIWLASAALVIVFVLILLDAAGVF